MIEELNLLNKKNRKRLLYLISSLSYSIIKSLPKVGEWSEDIHGKKRVDMLKELHQLFNIINYTEEERNAFYQKYRWIRRKESISYSAKPIREKKDNKDFYNGSGGYNRNKVRYPKKCRKTAWKRFAKLFPNLVKVKNGKIVKKN